jgi:UDP-N-acetylmuramyl pentapeptide phosphotransferase/UDP-N-acetylglucosamine-1-phosphate transferase
VSENLFEQRYGVGTTRRKDRVFAIVIGSLALVAFLVWALIFTIDDAQKISTRDVGFTVKDEFSTEVVFEVTRGPGQTVICDVQVLSQSFAVVGFKTIAVEPSGNRSVVVSTVVNTTELGTTGLVDSCR